MTVVLKRTVGDSDSHFDNLSGSVLRSHMISIDGISNQLINDIKTDEQ